MLVDNPLDKSISRLELTNYKMHHGESPLMFPFRSPRGRDLLLKAPVMKSFRYWILRDIENILVLPDFHLAQTQVVVSNEFRKRLKSYHGSITLDISGDDTNTELIQALSHPDLRFKSIEVYIEGDCDLDSAVWRMNCQELSVRNEGTPLTGCRATEK